MSDKQFTLAGGIEEAIGARAQELASKELRLADGTLAKMQNDYSDLLHENFRLKTEVDLLKKKLEVAEGMADGSMAAGKDAQRATFWEMWAGIDKDVRRSLVTEIMNSSDEAQPFTPLAHIRTGAFASQ